MNLTTILSYVELWLVSSVAQSCLTLWPHGLQHSRLPCPSSTPWACSSSCPSSRWCHPTISSSVIPFFSCFQSFPASGSFPESVLCIRWPESWSFNFSISLPINIQDWFQFKSEFGNKGFMNWATVSSQSCFCWLYRASPSLPPKNIILLLMGLLE